MIRDEKRIFIRRPCPPGRECLDKNGFFAKEGYEISMIPTILFAPVCQSWQNKKFEYIGSEIEECPLCSSVNTLVYHEAKSSMVWCWHIYVPEDWKYGNWETVKLYPSQVPLPAVICLQCNELIKIFPSFLIKGTTLTLPALIFIAFIYESSNLTWRDMREKFCTETDQIAHSTLYKAVHRMGKLWNMNPEIKKLYRKYLPLDTCNEKELTGWSPPKSVLEHTAARESGARCILARLQSAATELSGLCAAAFYRHIETVGRIFIQLKSSLPSIYGKYSPTTG